MIFLNLLFHSLHLVIIFSSLTLFLFKDLVVIHLCLQASILFSWLIIGPILNKPGMCLLTELQKKMGLSQNGELPHSYIVFLCQKLGYKGNDFKKIDRITFTIFGVCTFISAGRFIFGV